MYLSTKLAEILAVLTDFHLLDLLPQTSTITGACKSNIGSVIKQISATHQASYQFLTSQHNQVIYRFKEKVFTLCF